MDLCEFNASMVYKMSSRSAELHRETLLQKVKEKGVRRVVRQNKLSSSQVTFGHGVVFYDSNGNPKTNSIYMLAVRRNLPGFDSIYLIGNTMF